MSVNKINTILLRLKLQEAEGLRLHIYKDQFGNDTIGHGHKIQNESEKNKYLNGLTKDQAVTLLDFDMNVAIDQAIKNLPFFNHLDECRQRVVIEMIFNLGLTGFSNFKKTIEAIEKKDFSLAAEEMMKSKWSSQVKNRALRLSNMMKNGTDL